MPKFVVIRKYVVNLPEVGSSESDDLIHEMRINVPASERSSNTTTDALTYVIDSSTVGDHTDKVVLARQSWATMRTDDPDWGIIGP